MLEPMASITQFVDVGPQVRNRTEKTQLRARWARAQVKDLLEAAALCLGIWTLRIRFDFPTILAANA